MVLRLLTTSKKNFFTWKIFQLTELNVKAVKGRNDSLNVACLVWKRRKREAKSVMLLFTDRFTCYTYFLV
jgi:hypothetical protein